MDFASFVILLADVTFVAFVGIFIVAAGLFFFDRPPRTKFVELKLVERERHAA